jgi:hypothetical protein
MPTLVSTGQFTIVDVNDGPISNLTPPSELTSVVADSMGGWTRLAGALSNSSIVNNQVGPNGEYPRILRVVGDGTIVGWYTLWRYWFKVDISKAYVTYCWVRKRSATSTNLYLGWTNGANFVDTLAGVNEPNPYFISAQNPTIADKWYLCVGVIWPSGYGSGDTGLAGMYDPYTGIRVFDGNEFRHNTGATQQYLRFGFYNNITAQSSADGYDFLPVGTYCMDGTHPTKEAIMNTVPAAMTAALSKETYVFPANSDGSVPAASYTGSGTQIRVYQGAAELTYDGTGTAKGTWRIASTSATNITIGSITDSGTFATVADHSGVAAGTDTSTITYNIEGTTLTGASFTLVKTQTFAKAKGGVPGSNGVRTAVLDMYRWSATAPSTFPTGSSTYTWATGAFTAPATTNSWTLVPDLPVAGQTLYIARQIFTDTGTSATSSVTWNVSSSIAYSSAGVNGQRVGILELYQWAAVAPTTFPAGTSTYTWATGAFTAPGTPNSWSLTPGAPSTGQTLWATSVRVSNNDTTATSTVTWNSSTAYAVGYAGSNGQPGERGSKEFFAAGGSWSDTTANTAISNAGLTKVLLDQVTISNGTSFAETRFWNGTAWATISQVINGNLLVNGTVGANALIAGTVLANVFNVGSTNFQLDGAAQGAGKGALFVKNGANTILTAGYLDGSTVGLSLKDAAGNIIMQTTAAVGGTTPTNTYNNAISNNNIAINGSGQLTGIGTANIVVDNTRISVNTTTGQLEGVGGTATVVANNQITVNGTNGQLQGIGTSNVIVDNTRINIDANGNLTGTGATPTVIANNQITVSSTTGQISGIGTGNNQSIANNRDNIIRDPGGALSVNNAASVSGAIKIRLPQSWTDTMMRFTVDIYEYVAGFMCTMEIGGYNYSGGGGNPYWANVTARVMGGSNVEYPVYFGHDGTRCCVWIGTNIETWAYPQIRVKDFLGGHSNSGRDLWSSGWTISFDTTTLTGIFGGAAYAANYYNASVIDTLPGADWSKTSKRPANLSALAGTETIQNGLITINSSGQLAGIGTANVVVSNNAITVDSNGVLQGTGTSNVVVNNNRITVDASGVLQGAGTSNVVVNNSQIAVNSSGQLTGIGSGANTVVDNSKVLVGARNLMTNSGQFTSTAGWASNGAAVSLDNTVLYGSYNTLKIVGFGGAEKSTIMRLKANTQYTISAMVKGSAALSGGADTTLHVQSWRDEDTGNVHQETAVVSDTAVTTSWKLIYYTFVTPSSATLTYCRFYFYPLVAGFTLNVGYVKLEEGNKATDWTQAPEELTSGINSAALTANWPNVTGTGKPDDGANNTYVDGSGRIQGVSSGASTMIANNAITVDLNGVLQGTGTSNVVVNNGQIAVNASGQITGIGSGNTTTVANSQIAVSGGAISGIGTGSGTMIANNAITVDLNGILQGAGTSNVVVNNGAIAINGSGQITGIGSGNTTTVANNQITVSSGAINGIGAGSGTLIDNNFTFIGQNILPNSDAAQYEDWRTVYNPNGANISSGPTLAKFSEFGWTTSNYVLAGTETNNIFVLQSGIATGTVDGSGDGAVACDIYPYEAGNMISIPALPNEQFIASVYLANHRCRASVFLGFFNTAGTALLYQMSSSVGPTEGNANTLSSYIRAHVKATAPANTAYVRLFIRKFNTLAGQTDSWLWWAAPQLERVNSGVTTPSPYQPGQVSSTRQLGYSGTLDANTTSVDGVGRIQGVSSGAGTTIANSQITVSGGAISGIGTGSGTMIANNAITVDLNGILQGTGTSNIVVNNGQIAVNASGQITGIGSGNTTTVANSQITISGGNLNGIGTGSGTAVANDSVRSGGVNLVGNSGFLRYAAGLPVNWAVYNNGGISTTTSVQAGGLFGQNYIRITSNAATTSTLGIYVAGNTADSVKSWLPGQTYCISFWAKGSAGMLGKTMEGFYSNMGFTNGVALENPAVTENWQRYVFRGIPANNANTPVGELYISWYTTGTLASGSVLDITCPKVELGSQPSSWTPSPQDTLNQNITISSGQLNGIGAGSGTTVANGAITVDSNGVLQGVGTSSVVVNNGIIAINGSGQITGIGSGNTTTVANNQITISDGNLNGIGTGSGTAVANSLVPLGSNLCINSDFINSTTGWQAAWDGTVGGTINRGLNLSGWFGQLNVLYATRVGTPALNTVFDVFINASTGAGVDGLKQYSIPVLPGDRLYFSWLLGPHRCSAYSIIGWYDGAGNYVGETGANTVVSNGGASNGNPDTMVRSWAFATAPANARYARTWVRAVSTAETDPYIFCAQPFISKVSNSQTTAPAYSSGPADRAATKGATIGTDLAGIFTETEFNNRFNTNIINGTYLKDATIVNAKIADLAVSTAKIVNGAITNAKIGDLEVNNAKITNLTIGTQKITDLAISRSSSSFYNFAGFSYPTNYTWYDLVSTISNYVYVGVNAGSYDYVFSYGSYPNYVGGYSYQYVGPGQGDYDLVTINAGLITSVVTGSAAESGSQVVNIEAVVVMERDGGSDDNLGARVIRTNDSTVLPESYSTLRARSGKSTYALMFRDPSPIAGTTNTYKVQLYNNNDDSHIYEAGMRATLFRK